MRRLGVCERRALETSGDHSSSSFWLWLWPVFHAFTLSRFHAFTLHPVKPRDSRKPFRPFHVHAPCFETRQTTRLTLTNLCIGLDRMGLVGMMMTNGMYVVVCT